MVTVVELAYITYSQYLRYKLFSVYILYIQPPQRKCGPTLRITRADQKTLYVKIKWSENLYTYSN